MCALSTDSQKTYLVNTLVGAATTLTGGKNPLGGKKRKRPEKFCQMG